MTASLYDSPAWRGLFHDTELSPLFTDTAELRANLLVMGTLALSQVKAGVVPEIAAKAIQRAAMEVQIDPAALASITAETGNPVLAVIAQFQSEMKAPEYAKWVHHDSDPALTAATGLSLRLRQALKIIAARLSTGDVPKMTAYHADPSIAAGLATGLGLQKHHDADPIADVRALAAWIITQSEARVPQTEVHRAVRHQISHLNAAIQSAPDDAAALTNMMTLPQMMLGLGRLLM